MLRFRELLILGVVTLMTCTGARAADCVPWSAPGRHEVSTGDVKLTVRTLGAGTPIVFVPALGRGVGDFDTVAAQLSNAGYLAVLPDPRGIDHSSGPTSGATLDDLARDVLDVIRAACAGPAFVAGHAFGGRVAARAALLEPESVRGLIMLGVSASRPIEPDLKAALGGSAAQGFKARVDRLNDLEYAYFAPGNDAHVWLMGWHPFAASTQNRISNRSDREDLSALRVNTLILRGDADVVGTLDDAKALAKLVGVNAFLVRVPQAGRALLPEQPDAVAAAMLAFMSGRLDEMENLIRAHIRGPTVGARGVGQEIKPRG